MAKTLNTEDRLRAILLTERELEPYHIYERTKAKFDIISYGSTPEHLACNTAKMYFVAPPDLDKQGSTESNVVAAGETKLS